MRSSQRHFQSAILVAVLLQSPSARAVLVGQSDTFEDGTTQNWVINLAGVGSPPAAAFPDNVADGGPMGANDNYLRLTSLGGGGAGGRLTVINFMDQWAGDYMAAGVGSISMDVNNFGAADLFLRLMLANPILGPPSDVAVSSIAVFLPAGSGWTSVEFPITPADLTAQTGSVTDALSTATELRLFHGSTATFPGEPISASLGVDNITAQPAAIPEPSIVLTWGVLSGLFGLITWSGARRKKDCRHDISI
jgi:hypothetical protein